MKFDIPERFTGDVFIYVHTDPNCPSLYGELTVCHHDFGDDCPTYLKVGCVSVDIPLMQEGAAEKQIQALQKVRSDILREATEKVEQIDGHIQSLLAIEHKDKSHETA